MINFIKRLIAFILEENSEPSEPNPYSGDPYWGDPFGY